MQQASSIYPAPAPLPGYTSVANRTPTESLPGDLAGVGPGGAPVSPPEKKRILGRSPDRSCTDVVFLVLLLLFWAGVAAIAVLAFLGGDPMRLLYGTDFLGNTCGVTKGSPHIPTSVELNLTSGGGSWESRKYIWYPISGEVVSGLSTVDALEKVLKLGVCVRACPKVQDKTLLTYTSHKVWPINYPSTTVLNRCLPSDSGDWLNTFPYPGVARLLMQGSVVANFVERMVAELARSWPVLAACGGLAVAISLAVLLGLQWVTWAVVHIVMTAMFLLLGLLGVTCLLHARDMADDLQLSGDVYVSIFRGLGIAFLVLLALYFLLAIFLWRRINIAIEILSTTAEVTWRAYGMLTVPVVTMLLFVAWTAFCVALWAYLESYGKLAVDQITIFSKDVSNVIPGGGSASNVPIELGNMTVNFLSQDSTRHWLSLYVLVGYIWTAEFLSAICFMIIAFVTVMWYFGSTTQHKPMPMLAVPTALWFTLRYHLGTLAFGSMVIAVLQLIRLAFLWIVERVRRCHGAHPLLFVGCCVSCVLSCAERLLRFVSKNAYVVCCVQSSGFCQGSILAAELLMANLAQVAAANFITDCIIVLAKLVVTLANVAAGYALLTFTQLAPEVQVKAVPLVLIGIFTYVIASLFLHVFSCVQDSLLLCFCCDMDQNDGSETRPYHFNAALSDLVHKYNVPPSAPAGVARPPGTRSSSVEVQSRPPSAV